MKKLFFILFLALLPACEIVDFISDIDEVYETVEEQYWEGKYIGKIEKYDFPGSEGIPEFETIEEALNFVKTESTYASDIDMFQIREYWQTPEEFYYNKNENNEMQGDCEDYSIFLGYILHFIMGYEVFIMGITGQDSLHGIIYCDDRYLDPQGKEVFFPKNNIKLIIPYEEMLWMAINYHHAWGKYNIKI